MKIRYAIIQDSAWYSIRDIVNWLVENKFIPKKNRIVFDLIQSLSKRNSKGDCAISFNQTICIEPFDEFVNWVVVANIMAKATTSQKEGISNSSLLHAIDGAKVESIKKYYPGIYKDLKLVKFTLK